MPTKNEKKLWNENECNWIFSAQITNLANTPDSKGNF